MSQCYKVVRPEPGRRGRKAEPMKVDKKDLADLFVSLGAPQAKDWDVAKLKLKVGRLKALRDPGTVLADRAQSRLYDTLVAAVDAREPVEVEGLPKAAAAKPKKKPVKETPPSKPKAGKDQPNGKPKASKAGRGSPDPMKPPGVIDSIEECLRAASASAPITRQQIVDKLAARFPDRRPESLAHTVGSQVSSQLRALRGLNVKTDGKKGYWIPAGAAGRVKAAAK